MNVMWTNAPFFHEEHNTIVAKVRDFSNVNLHKPGENSGVIDYDKNEVIFSSPYPMTVEIYPNGHDSSTKDAISIVFREPFYEIAKRSGVQFIELACVIAVIDAEGERRFSRSFVLFRDFMVPRQDPNLVIDHYISRSILLNEPSELLPNDALTLHLDTFCKECGALNVEILNDFNRFMGYYKGGPQGQGIRPDRLYYLSVDSDFAKRLCEESRDLKFLLLCGNNEDRWIKIRREDYYNFRIIGGIFFRRGIFRSILFDSLQEIFGVYMTADKYNIVSVIDMCRCWLKLCLSLENLSDISEFADNHNDNCLKKAVEAFEMRGKAKHDCHLHSISTDGRWSYSFDNERYKKYCFFNVRYLYEEEEEINEEESFNFYS